MKQVLRKGFADIVVTEVPDPVVTPNHVVIRPEASLISSGTETASIHKDGVLKEVADNPSHLRKVWDTMMATNPQGTVAEIKARFNAYAVLGYSGAGVVIDRHPSVQDLQIGDRVAYGGEGTGHGEAILAGRNLVARIPEQLTFEEASFSTLGAIAMNAVRVSGVGVGDVVAVIGLGLVGQLTSQLARAQGARVIGIDLKPQRMDLARQLGAEATADGGAALSTVLGHTDGRGADVVIVAAASKGPEPARLALTLCRDRGRMVIVGAVDITLPWNDMYLKEIQLFMSRAYGPGSYDPAYELKGQDYPVSYVRWTENRNMEEFLRLCAKGQVAVRPLITHRYPLEQAAAAYDTIMAPATSSLAVILEYPRVSAQTPSAPAVYTPHRRVVVSTREFEGVGVALVGASNIAKWAHVPVIKKTSGAYLRAVVSSSGARGRNYAERFGANYCTSDYADVLSDAQVDAVIVTSRNQHHAADSLAALRAGKHVFVEKPMALTEAECGELEKAVADTGKTLFVGFNRRFAPPYLEMKRAFGRRSAPAVIHCRVNSPGIAGSFWMADPAIGGAILGEACHFADLMYWLLESEPISVSATSLPTNVKDPIGENNLVATVQFADGSIGSLTYCTVGSRTSGGERVEVFAPGIGVMTEDFKRVDVKGSIKRARSSWFAQKGYDAQMAHFLAAIRTGEAASVNVRDGSRSTLVCLRMLASAREHSPKPVNLTSLTLP